MQIYCINLQDANFVCAFFFTLQSCFGHFVYPGQESETNLIPLPAEAIREKIEYRIAYLAICIDHGRDGESLLAAFADVLKIDPMNVHFGCAEWFWNRQVNSYALQVEPDRFKNRDTAILGYQEARMVQDIRDRFYEEIGRVLSRFP